MTPNETLIKAMEGFGEHEPLRCLVIWEGEDGLGYIGSGTCVESTGLAVTCQDLLRKHSFYTQEDDCG